MLSTTKSSHPFVPSEDTLSTYPFSSGRWICWDVFLQKFIALAKRSPSPASRLGAHPTRPNYNSEISSTNSLGPKYPHVRANPPTITMAQAADSFDWADDVFEAIESGELPTTTNTHSTSFQSNIDSDDGEYSGQESASPSGLFDDDLSQESSSSDIDDFDNNEKSEARYAPRSHPTYYISMY